MANEELTKAQDTPELTLDQHVPQHAARSVITPHKFHKLRSGGTPPVHDCRRARCNLDCTVN